MFASIWAEGSTIWYTTASTITNEYVMERWERQRSGMVHAQQKTQQLWWVCKEAAVEKGAGHCPEGSARFF